VRCRRTGLPGRLSDADSCSLFPIAARIRAGSVDLAVQEQIRETETSVL